MLVEKEWTHIQHIPVRWGDMDAFNHLNNTVYFRYMETARVEYFQHIQWMPDEITTAAPILAHTSCQFLRPVNYPDTISVGIRAKRLGETSLVQEYALFSSEGHLVAQGDSVVVCFNFETQTKMPFPETLRKRISEVEVAL